MLQRYIVFVKSVLRPHINVKHESFLGGFITLLLTKLKTREKALRCFNQGIAMLHLSIRILQYCNSHSFSCDSHVVFNSLQSTPKNVAHKSI